MLKTYLELSNNSYQNKAKHEIIISNMHENYDIKWTLYHTSISIPKIWLSLWELKDQKLYSLGF